MSGSGSGGNGHGSTALEIMHKQAGGGGGRGGPIKNKNIGNCVHFYKTILHYTDLQSSECFRIDLTMGGGGGGGGVKIFKK